jgi:hypothetical protein
MYKKITHNIVEEHFDHPMAAKIKAGIRPTITRKARLNIDNDDIIFGRPTSEIFNKADFTARLESYLNNYTQKLIQITDATAGTEEQLANAFEELFNFIDEIGDFFDPFYNREFGERITTSMRHIASMTAMISHTVKAGWDPAAWIRSLNQAVSVADFQNYNDRWTRFSIENIMREFTSSMVKRINAIKDKDQQTIDQSTRDMFTSIMLFKGVIINGITQQFPSRFID